jgi:hypothetical protein
MKALNENPRAMGGSGLIDIMVMVECTAEGTIYAQGLFLRLCCTLALVGGLRMCAIFLCDIGWK